MDLSDLKWTALGAVGLKVQVKQREARRMHATVHKSETKTKWSPPKIVDHERITAHLTPALQPTSNVRTSNFILTRAASR